MHGPEQRLGRLRTDHGHAVVELEARHAAGGAGGSVKRRGIALQAVGHRVRVNAAGAGNGEQGLTATEVFASLEVRGEQSFKQHFALRPIAQLAGTFE
ncbi:hypothetical protein D3C81_2057610 [compost metagenome]